MGLIKAWCSRARQDQILDAIGLIFQGWMVPIIALFLANHVLPLFLPDWRIESIPHWVLFLLPFTLVDYLYYWNHRLLHHPKLWFLHRTHHSSEKLDVFVTSRNSIWTPFMLIYIWFQSFLMFLTRDTQAYAYGLWLMGALDLWRHSGLSTPKSLRFLGSFLVLPEDHEWHHSSEKYNVNFGANLNLWDRLHGTYFHTNERAEKLGAGRRSNLANELFFPWRMNP